ncbi:MAG: ABC transporter ATP-binding protein [Ruminococcaceae bacterium]|nr:ABC transporter ATP-binding protein [Oscillospiraceae bacterium]
MIRKFLSFYKPYIGLFALDMGCTVSIAAVELIFPVATRYAINELLPQSAYTAFFWLMAVLLIGYVVRACLQFVVSYWGHTMGVYMETDMKRELFTHMQKLPFSFFDQNRTGSLMSRITSDLFEIVELAHHGPEDVVISVIELVGAIVIMWTLQWEMAVLLLILAPLILLFTAWRRKRMAKSSREVKEKIGVINSDIESSISGARVAKAFTNEAYEVEKFERGNQQYKTARKTFYREMGIFHSGMEFFTSLFQIAVIALGGFLIMRDGMELVDLLTFSLYVGTFIAPIRRLANFAEQYNVGMAGFKRFCELLSIEPEIADKEDAQTLSDVRGDVRYENVTFSYNEGESVLADVSLSIKAGKTVALVGPSGGGKTTLCHLLPRFYESTAGTITVDGSDIRDVTLSSLRQAVGIVQQEVLLFADTIRENIRYGRLDATDEEVEEAARLAEIHDDILQMPDGYDTYVGERGLRLSGGQKQRVSIARIFLKNPPILILDEATSALDTVTEAKIQASFERLSRNRTTLVIAHRLSTIRHADSIVYIDQNGIREQGSHEELMARNGLYAKLYNAIKD